MMRSIDVLFFTCLLVSCMILPSCWAGVYDYNTWQSEPAPLDEPDPSVAHTLQAITSSLVVFGGVWEHQGFSEFEVVRDFHRIVWAYDTIKHRWSRLYEVPDKYCRINHAAARTHLTMSSFFVFGGRNIHDKVTNSLLQVSLYATNEVMLTRGSPIPPARHLASLDIVHGIDLNKNRCLLLFGGIDDDNNVMGDTWLYDIDMRKWNQLDNLSTSPSPRFGAAMATNEGNAYLTSGCDSKTGDCFKHLNATVNGLWRFVLDTENSTSCDGGRWELVDPYVKGIGVAEGTQRMAFFDNHLYFYGTDSAADRSELELMVYDQSSSTVSFIRNAVARFSQKPSSRFGLGLCQTKDGIYIFGGNSMLSLLQDLWIYRPSEAIYIHLENQHESDHLISSAAVSVHDRIVIYGGMGADSRVTEDLYIVYPSDLKLRWPKSTNMPGPRRSHSLTLWRGLRAVLYGGSNSAWQISGDTGGLWVLDMRNENSNSWEWKIVSDANGYSSRLPTRAGHSAHFVDDDTLIIFGGWTYANAFDFDTSVSTNEVLRAKLSMHTMGLSYSVEWSKVTTKGPFPVGRGGHASMHVNTKTNKHFLVVYGGCGSGGEVQRDMWKLDVETWQWSEITRMLSSSGAYPLPFLLGKATIAPNRFAVFGGLNSSASSFVSDRLFVGYPNDDVSAWAWVDIPTHGARNSRFNPAMATLNHSIYILGGGDVRGGVIYCARGALMMRVGCTAGQYSDTIPITYCNSCPMGTYQDQPGSTSCKPCPGDSTTEMEGASSVSMCSICQDGICGHGTCELDATTKQSNCVCWPGWSGSTCNINTTGIAVGVVFSLLAILFVGLFWWSCMRHKVKTLEQYSELQEHLITETRQELDELSKIWEIDPNDINFVRRIDKNSEGAFGEVWFAEWQARPVAVKKLKSAVMMMDEKAAEEFDSEAKFLRSLRHRNIVFFYGAGSMQGQPFLVTEFMSQGSLRSILDKEYIDISEKEKIKFAVDAAAGMEFLHSLDPPRIHRDIKSANFLVSDTGIVKVSDFGTARLVSHLEECLCPEDIDAKSVTSTMTGNQGTLLWQAPEIFRGALLYGTKVDVYSFGITLWEIWSRKIPFRDIDGGPWKIRDSVLNGVRPETDDKWNRDIVELMKVCWEDNPTNRPEFPYICETLRNLQQDQPETEEENE